MANLITLARIALIVPFSVFFLLDVTWGLKAALIVFLIASISDFLDGWVARMRNEVSALGAALDPLADKLLITAALVLLLRNGIVSGAGVIAVLIIILREILISGLREAVTKKGGELPVTTLAKWKTAAQLIAAGLMLASAPLGFLSAEWRPLGAGALWFAAMLTFWTGADYAARALHFLRSH